MSHQDQSRENFKNTRTVLLSVCSALLLLGAGSSSLAWAAEKEGVTDTVIKVGGVVDLKGDNKARGLAVKAGVEAAFKGQTIQGRSLEYIVENDFYNPKIAVEATKKLVDQEIFAMLGSVGTSQARSTLPILAEYKVPAIGFFTGANVVRPGVGDVVNFRASYDQEVAYMIDVALQAGVRPQEICAYVQGGPFGMAGVSAMKKALEKQPGTANIIEKLDQILTSKKEVKDRNNIGPVGIYQRDTVALRKGYKSLKKWEKEANTTCRFVAAVGPYKPISRFLAYSNYKGEAWVVGGVSAVSTNNLNDELIKSKINFDKIFVTQVVPSPSQSDLPIVQEARKALGYELTYISLESFIDAKMFLVAMNDINGDITRENFLKEVYGKTFDLGGLKLDFTNDNQGSDAIWLTYRKNQEFKPTTIEEVKKLFQ